jgi:O-antigen ligase
LSTIVVFGGMSCLLLIAGFFTAARAGWLGERSMLQFRSESVDVWTIMVNGRPEGLQSLYLISEEPFGWGSAPELDGVTFARSLAFISDNEVEVFVNLPKDWLVKTNPGLAAHSSALDTLVQAGLLAVPFWAFVLFVGLRRAMNAIRTRAGPLTVFWTVAVVWNVLFEPLVWPKHVLLAGYLALVLLPLPRSAVTTKELR